MQRAAAHDIDQLRTPADSQQRDILRQRPVYPLNFQLIALWIGLDLRIKVAAIMLWTNVGAAPDDQSIQWLATEGMANADALWHRTCQSQREQRAPPAR